MPTDPTERLVNLALLLAAARRPVSAAEIASHVPGYPEGQTPEAFGRMFERDKDDLRSAGLVVTLDREGDVERYRIDEAATFSDAIDLTPVEAVELRTAAAAMLADRSFPFTDELRPAISKVVAVARTPAGSGSAILASASSDEAPESQGYAAAVLTGAVTARKRVRFGYTGAAGRASRRETEPWGLFARDGRWYLVAFDPALAEARVFAVLRMSDITVAARPKTPDFERPAGFDVASYMLMPFQYGPRSVEAAVRFTGAAARRAETLTAGQGALAPDGGDAFDWRVAVASEELLAKWIVANGPGIRALSPASLVARVRDGLAEVVRLHG